MYRVAQKFLFSNTEPYLVDYIIRPNGAYPGGNYGHYGGFDIVLIKLKKEIQGARPVCLPKTKVFRERYSGKV